MKGWMDGWLGLSSVSFLSCVKVHFNKFTVSYVTMITKKNLHTESSNQHGESIACLFPIWMLCAQLHTYTCSKYAMLQNHSYFAISYVNLFLRFLFCNFKFVKYYSNCTTSNTWSKSSVMSLYKYRQRCSIVMGQQQILNTQYWQRVSPTSTPFIIFPVYLPVSTVK